MTKPHDNSAGTIAALYAILAYQGYTMAINGIGAPFIAASFGLRDAGIARLYAWISLAAVGVLLLSRLADRVGRRRILLACTAATPVAALAVAAARTQLLFTLTDILLYTCIGTAVTISVVVLAELLPTEQRARGQSFGGLALTIGAGLCLILMPGLARHGLSWRWLLVLSGVAVLGIPLLPRAIPESQRWRDASERGATSTARFFDVFRAPHRARAVPIALCMFLGVVAGTSADAWSYYHAVSTVGLSPTTASIMVVTCGGLAMVGFPLGAWGSERFGRVPTVVTSLTLASVGTVCFYWGPPHGSTAPVYWLGVAYFWMKTVDNAAIVGFRAASTELFPTAMRGTVLGWTALIGALGAMATQSSIALLAGPLGGLSRVVGYLALLTLPSAYIFGRYVAETRGLSLEVAAGEPEG